jgi:hypothetical protein
MLIRRPNSSLLFEELHAYDQDVKSGRTNKDAQRYRDKNSLGVWRTLEFLPIFLVDHHEAFRRALRFLLSWHKCWLVCGEAVDGLEAVEKAKALRPGCRAQADSAGLSLLTTNDAEKMNGETV